MKKRFLFLLPLLCLTGCEDGQKTLTCERIDDLNEKEVVKLSYNKEGNKLLNAEFSEIYSIEEEYEKELMVPLLKDECKDMANSKGISCQVKENKKSVSLILKMNISKMTEEELEEIDIEEIMNYENAKKDFEEAEYICR